MMALKVLRVKKASKALLASLVIALPLAVASIPVTSSPAYADSGFCGVRVSGPIWAGSSYVYELHNKCGSGYHWAVYLPTYGRYAVGSSSGTRCQWDPAYSYDYYWSPSPDPNWYIVNC
jgi:hypothetical protein